MRHLMGSTYFFKNYPNFFPNDTDYVELITDDSVKGLMIIRGHGEDVFLYRKKDKEDMIKDALKLDLGMVLGKFLISEFNEELGFTVEDLPKLEPLLSKLDEKHKYEEIIFNAYIKNQAFTLTQKQRDKAFDSYKESRRYIKS